MDVDDRMAVTPREAARRLSVSSGHVYNMIQSGQLRAAKLGGRYVIPVEELHRILHNLVEVR